MNLWINFYLNPARNHELLYCLQNNLENPLIKKIYLVGEVNYEDEKIVFIKHEGRPTFADFIRYISECEPRSINIIANADIYFDETLQLVGGIRPNEVYALSRWEEVNEGLKLFDRWDSQDAWVIGAISRVDNCDFMQGVSGCDNAFAARLDQAGYIVSNPSKDVRAIHVHQNNVTEWAKKDSVQKSYLLINPHHLGDEPVTHRII